MSAQPSPTVEHKSWRTRKLYAEEGWDDKQTRVKRRQSAMPNLFMVGMALVIIVFWLLSSRNARTFPFVYALLGVVHGIQAIVKARRNRLLRQAGTEVAKVFD